MNPAPPTVVPPTEPVVSRRRLRLPFARGGRGAAGGGPAPATAAGALAAGAFLLPAPETPGAWQLRRREEDEDAPGKNDEPLAFDSLDAAIRALEPEEEFVLALPLDLGLVARFRLPEAPDDELRAMIRLQLEKVLPYAEENLDLDYAVVERHPGGEGEGGEVSLATYVLHLDRLSGLTQSFNEADRWPQLLTFGALLHASASASASSTANQQVAADPADGRSTLLAYREGGETILGVLERGRLVFSQGLPVVATPETLDVELPPVLLGAELEGIPTDFTRLAFAESLPAPWREGFRRALPGLPPAVVPALPRPEAVAALGDLSPTAWRIGRGRRARVARDRRRWLLAGGVYVLLLILGFAEVTRLRQTRRRLDKRINAAAKPLAAADAARKRWLTLSPATDYRQSAVEILDQVRQCLPPGNNDLRITLLDLNRSRTPGILTLEGEAPSYEGAIELGEKLRTRGELRDFRLAPEQPAILPNGRARFRVTGRLP